MRKQYGLEIERQLVREYRQKGAYSERRPRSLGGTDVLRIFNNEIWLIQSKTTSKPVLYVNKDEVNKLLKDKEVLSNNLDKYSIPIKAIFYVARIISPNVGQKARRINKYLEVDKIKGETLKVQFEPLKVNWIG
jgi:Holliday junction resolvase